MKTLTLKRTIESDCAPLNDIVSQLINAGIDIHCMRDLTRGGLASALNEISKDASKAIQIDESSFRSGTSSFRVRDHGI